MNAERIQIECVKVADVYDFAQRTLAAHTPGDAMPVSPHRARAWAHNPCAEPDDVALIVATRGGRCLGYMGLMPGRLWIDGKIEKMSWFSTWFVPDEYRQTGVGAMLIMRAIGLRRDLAVTFFSPEASRVYQALRFKPVEPLRYLQLRFHHRDPLSAPLRLVRKFVGRRGGKTERLNKMVSLTVRPWKRLLYGRALSELSSLRAQYRVEPLAQVPPLERRASAGEAPHFLRQAPVVEWMLREPWLVTDPSQTTPDYYFHDGRELFEFVPLEIRGTDGESRGFAVLRLEERDGLRKVTVFDHGFGNPEDAGFLLPIALEQARRISADMVHLPQACESALERSSLARRLAREMTRPCFCYPSHKDSPLARAVERLSLDLADGDSAFA